MDFNTAATIALKNIAKHGDTDIFPFPFENLLFYDNIDRCSELLKEVNDNFSDHYNNNHPEAILTLSQVGYTGFRWATQIDPFWNAYYLSLVVQVADEIEKSRLSEDKKKVFSYRYEWNEEKCKLFKDSTWRDYKHRCIELAGKFQYVVITDIADFYPRIYHHRIENGLQRLQVDKAISKKIDTLLQSFSNNLVSYGLPVGGPASRILSELALTSVDRHLLAKGIEFCRYADDFCIFCNDISEAYKCIVLLSEKLMNEGLVLQKKKTRILTSEEYLISSESYIAQPEINEHPNEVKLLNLSLRFDPYSPTAEEDYEDLKKAIEEIDIIDILGREIAKTAIDPTVSKQAINAIKALDKMTQGRAIRIVLDPDNLDVLSPVFLTILRLVRSVYDNLYDMHKDSVDKTLLKLHDNNFYLFSVEINLSYLVQVLGLRWSEAKEEKLVKLYDQTTSPLVRRLIIQALANWNCHYWVSDIKTKYATLSSWEKRSFILASYILEDEGVHWRRKMKKNFSTTETSINDWFSERYKYNKAIPV